MFKNKNNYIAVLLHSYAYKNTSLIVTLWVRELGVINAMMFTSKKGYRAQPFSTLQVYLKINNGNSLSKVFSVEQLQAFYITNEFIYKSMKLNAILYKTLIKHDPCPGLFDKYCHLLKHMTVCGLFMFKKQLLETLGYGMQCSVDIEGKLILKEKLYRTIPLNAFIASETGISGELIFNMNKDISLLNTEDFNTVNRIIHLHLKTYYTTIKRNYILFDKLKFNAK